MHKSPFGLDEGDWRTQDSLHLVDPEGEKWISLRGVHGFHPPQVFEARSVRSSPMNDLLWSESQGEWTHPGEPRAKGRRPVQSPVPSPPIIGTNDRPPNEAPASPPDWEPPTWMTAGLVCTGCKLRTKDWQTAVPDADRCVCKQCFAAGVR